MSEAKHIVGLSGGGDSTAMALWLADNEPREYTYICNATGNELPALFDHLGHVFQSNSLFKYGSRHRFSPRLHL